MLASHLKFRMRLDEGTAFVGRVAEVRPRGSASLSVSQYALEERERTTAAILEIPLGRGLTLERGAHYERGLDIKLRTILKQPPPRWGTDGKPLSQLATQKQLTERLRLPREDVIDNSAFEEVREAELGEHPRSVGCQDALLQLTLGQLPVYPVGIIPRPCVEVGRGRLSLLAPIVCGVEANDRLTPSCATLTCPPAAERSASAAGGGNRCFDPVHRDRAAPGVQRLVSWLHNQLAFRKAATA